MNGVCYMLHVLSSFALDCVTIVLTLHHTCMRLMVNSTLVSCLFFSIVNGICDSSVLGISLFTMYMQEIYLHASYS